MADFTVVEAYSRLKSLKQHLPFGPVSTKYIVEFHQVLDLLESSGGFSLANFRIPAAEVRPVQTGGNFLTGDVHYSHEPYADHAFVMMKVEAVLTMFDLLQSSASPEGPMIGFTPRTSDQRPRR